MSGFGDPVGRALLNADPPNTKRIADLDFRFEVTGESLGDLGREAGRVAAAFYGDTPWQFISMSAGLSETPKPYYFATVWTQAT